jgi:hypothetical protein
MKNLGWILLAFILGILCSGCAKDRLTIVARSVQSDVEFEVQYNVSSNSLESRNR